MVIKREPHRRDTLHTAFNNNTHSTRIVHIDTRVVTMIDATDNHVGLAVIKLMQRHLDAVDRCARATVNRDTFTLAHQIIVHWLRRSNGTTHPRTSTIRSHYEDIGHRGQQFG